MLWIALLMFVGFAAASILFLLTVGVALREKAKGDRYALAAGMLYGLLAVDERGNTIAKGPRQWKPAQIAYSAALVADGGEPAPDPLEFHTAGYDMQLPVRIT